MKNLNDVKKDNQDIITLIDQILVGELSIDEILPSVSNEDYEIIKASIVKKADTIKTGNLIKKYLRETYNIKASVKSDKFANGSSLNITYSMGPDTNIVKEKFGALQYGHFNSMEDMYEHNSDTEPVIIDGYQLETFKYVSFKQEISEEMTIKMAELINSKMNFKDVPSFESVGLDANFPVMFGNAWTWRQLIRGVIGRVSFVTGDESFIELLSVEYGDAGAFNDMVFTYVHGNKIHKTNSLKIWSHRADEYINNNNNNFNTTEKMEKVELKEGQVIEVTDKKSGTVQRGTLVKLNEKSIKVDIDGSVKLLMLANTDVKAVEVVSETKKATGEKEAKGKNLKAPDKVTKAPAKEKEAKEQPKKDSKADAKSKATDKPFFAFVKLLIADKVADFDKNTMAKSKVIELTAKGTKRLEEIKKNYLDDKFAVDVQKLLTDLADVGKNMREEVKADVKPAKEPKTKVEANPLVEMLTKVTDIITFEAAKKEVDKQKAQVITKKSETPCTLERFENGNIYVSTPENGKEYFCMPTRFGFHFGIK